MERQNSRRRRPPRQEQARSEQSQTPIRSTAPAKQHLPWRVLGWSLVACFLLVLAYLHYPSNLSLTPLTSSAHRQHQYHDHELDSVAAVRPRIELHPEEHAYRPARTQYLDWRIATDYHRPDGVLKKIYLINDLFPGPTIEARSGDTLVITVTNALQDESITLHWHGLHVSNAMDGAAGVSQCSIAPGGQFVYKFTIPLDQSGTFWYHAHSGVSRADGLYGGLVVHALASQSTVRGLMSRERVSDSYRYGYEKELLLLIGDWYHRPASEVLAWYMLPGSFGNEPVPDSLLINGAGHFDCSMAVPARPIDCVDQRVNSSFIDLDANTSYRIRVVNTGALAGITMVFGREHLDLIQLDSVDVDRSEHEDVNSAGILFPGQRMDLVLHPSTNSRDSSSVMVQLDEGCFKYINPALTPDQTFPINYPAISPSKEVHVSPPAIRHHIDIEKVPSSPSVLKSLPPHAQQTHVVYTKIQKMARNHNVPFGYFNQTSWKTQRDPPMPLIALPRTQWDSNQFSFNTGPEPAWVDFVINNLDEGPHPFHLHGHHFYILTVYEASIGWGSYNPFVNAVPPGLESSVPSDQQSDMAVEGNSGSDPHPFQPYDLTRASLRDTVQIPSRGYAVLRFRADNPGVWLLHCHILWHLATGMAMLVDVQSDPAGLVAHESSLLSLGGDGLCPVS